MIEKFYPSKRRTAPVLYMPQKPTTYAPKYSPDEIKQSLLRKITPEEYVRREQLINKLASECAVMTGDTAFPSVKNGYDEYGGVMVIGVARSYKDLGPDHVWKNDNPMIVTFTPINNRSKHVFCTANYLVKKDPFEVVC